MEKNIFRRLQEQLDQYSLGFPATNSGIELDILREMFTEKEAAMFTVLTAELETPEAVAARLDRPIDGVAAELEDMALKGLLFRRRHGQTAEYSAIPFIHGLVEFQIERLDKKTVKLIGLYIKKKFKDVMSRNTKSFMRTIPIRHSIDVTHHVAAYDDACEILKKEKLIVITDCACRRQKALFGKDCGKPKEVCFMFGPMGQYYIDNGLGRRIDLDEAHGILAKAHKAGLVTQPASAQKPFTMCNCCGDCCGFLHAINQHPKPAELVFSNYTAVVDQEACFGCETCVERCEMGAVKMNGDGLSEIDPDRCIGCGLCVTTCPEEAVRLVPKPEAKHQTPPADTAEQMIRLAEKRGVESNDSSRIVSFGF
ncbi:MAG: 4Fe-4S binding protein [Deltaproteobacteria bacterium]|nr:4Fe-4S binding protein [Deltaproteobacteria bacterium]MBW1816721.1 4Fe-4S binding protein [Deltaproteobacteria bacterium]